MGCTTLFLAPHSRFHTIKSRYIGGALEGESCWFRFLWFLYKISGCLCTLGIMPIPIDLLIAFAILL